MLVVGLRLRGLNLLSRIAALRCRIHRPHRRDLQPHIRARVLRHLHVVLSALVFVHHVVVAGAVFIKSLGTALLDVLHLVVRALHPVAHHRAANQANDCGQRSPTAVANRIANGPASDCAQQSATPRFRRFSDDLLAVAHLTWYGHLLHNRRAGDDSGQDVCG